MKGWSLKIKVTLVYTLFMTLLTCVSLGLLFSLSSQEILESVQKELEDRVYDSTEEISVKKEKLVPDRDFYNLEWCLSVLVRHGWKFSFWKNPLWISGKSRIFRRSDTDCGKRRK